MPAFDWPIARFPVYKYPLEENERENAEEDERCLAMVEDLFEQWKKKGCDVAGIAVEPIQAEGGDNPGSPAFFQGLQRIAHKVIAEGLRRSYMFASTYRGLFWASLCDQYAAASQGRSVWRQDRTVNVKAVEPPVRLAQPAPTGPSRCAASTGAG